MKTQIVKIKEFKSLKDLELNISGNHVLLMGDNGVGKSSIQQFIEIAIGKQTNVPPNASGSGEVVFTKNGNEIVVKVKFKDGKPYLEVRGNGISIDNKKGAIADLFGAVEFDIDEFVNLSKSSSGRKEQIEIFKKFLPKEVRDELAKFEANLKNAESERTELNRDIKKIEGSIALHPLNNLPDFELTKFVETDTNEALELLKKANENNNNILRVENGIFESKQSVVDKNLEIAELQAKINSLNTDIEFINNKILDGQKWLAKSSRQDVSVFENAINSASENNTKYQQAQALLKERNGLDVLKNESGELTAKIESSREAIANAIRDMDSPVDGLSFDESTLVYKGVAVSPDSLSKSEIIELGIRMKMAENPSLGIILIKEGESIGSERLKVIKELADEKGWQIIMEQVDRGRELHLEIMNDV